MIQVVGIEDRSHISVCVLDDLVKLDLVVFLTVIKLSKQLRLILKDQDHEVEKLSEVYVFNLWSLDLVKLVEVVFEDIIV